MKEFCFLGFIVGGGELRVDPDKVKAIVDWPKPTSVTDVRSFLGVCRYLRKFIRHFSILASPLFGLTKAGVAFVWQPHHDKTFDLLKHKITKAPVLALTNLQRPFEIETYASDYAMGVLLLQNKRSVAFY